MVQSSIRVWVRSVQLPRCRCRPCCRRRVCLLLFLLLSPPSLLVQRSVYCYQLPPAFLLFRLSYHWCCRLRQCWSHIVCVGLVGFGGGGVFGGVVVVCFSVRALV